MNARLIRRSLGMVTTLLSLSAAATAMAAQPSGGAMKNDVRVLTEAVEKRGGTLICRTRNFDDHLAVCCAHRRGGRLYYKLYNRKQCRDLQGTEVARSKCPARHRSSDSQKSLVCCRTRETQFKGVYGKTVFNWTMMPAERCKAAPAGLVVDNSNCVRHRTARERMLECKNRGEDWGWDGRRCKRSAVRDRRGRIVPTRREQMDSCRKRGQGWVWRNDRCQRAAVRDKRNR